jgi:hypothetical protein
MISKSALEQSIKEVGDAVRIRKEELSVAQSSLIDAQRELQLLVDLAELRGLEVDQVRELTQEPPTASGRNGSSDEPGGRVSSPAKTALLGAVVEILAQRGEPMQIRELMATVQERGVVIPGSGQQANLIAHISRDDRIARPRRGYYALREWGIKDAKSATRNKRRRVHRSAGANTA